MEGDKNDGNYQKLQQWFKYLFMITIQFYKYQFIVVMLSLMGFFKILLIIANYIIS
jgi:hypothetical protein